MLYPSSRVSELSFTGLPEIYHRIFRTFCDRSKASTGSYLGLDEPFALPWVLMVYLSALAAALLVKKPRLTYRMLAGGVAGLLTLN